MRCALTLGSSDVDPYGSKPSGLTPTVPTAGVCRPAFVALAGVFVAELVEVFDLWRDDPEPLVEGVELVDIVDAVEVFAKFFEARAERREVEEVLVPVAGEKLGVK